MSADNNKEKLIVVWSGQKDQPLLTPDYEQNDRTCYPAPINIRAMRGLHPGSKHSEEDRSGQ